MAMHSRFLGTMATTFAMLQLLSGCGGSSDNLPREGVSGAVAIEGKPLAKGLITFLPNDPETVTQGGSVVIDGKYDIPQSQGLVPGKYKVVISSPEDKGEIKVDMANNAPGLPPIIRPEVIPRQYNAESLLTAEVKANAKNVFEFNLTNTTVSKK